MPPPDCIIVVEELNCGSS